MKDRSQNEDRTIREILEALETADESSAGAPEIDDTLRRLQLETLGLLAYDAEPVEPRPEVEDRLMAALSGEDPGEGLPGEAGPGEDPSVVPVAERPGRRPAPPASVQRTGRRSFWTGLAAVVALAALGLAAMLWVELDRSRESLARLEEQQRELTARLEVQENLARAAGRLGDVVSVASTEGVEICPLRPVSDAATAPGAFAVLYMPPADRSWYLVASDLEPRPDGVYKVWLETPEGPRAGGVIDLKPEGPGDRITLSLPSGLLQGRRMLSVRVTLEPSPDVERPTGPTVLFGDEKMQVL